MKSSESSENEFLRMIEGVDLEEGLKRIGGNESLFVNILVKFYESNIDFAKSISQSVKDGDMELSVRKAHTLKGVSGSVGAMEVFELARALEKDLKENDGKNFSMMLSKLEQSLNLVLSSIKQNLPVEAEEAKEIFSKEELMEKINKLEELLENFDSEAAEVVKELGDFKEFEAEINNLKEDVFTFDFDGALKTIQLIKTMINHH